MFKHIFRHSGVHRHSHLQNADTGQTKSGPNNNYFSSVRKNIIIQNNYEIVFLRIEMKWFFSFSARLYSFLYCIGLLEALLSLHLHIFSLFSFLCNSQLTILKWSNILNFNFFWVGIFLSLAISMIKSLWMEVLHRFCKLQSRNIEVGPLVGREN